MGRKRNGWIALSLLALALLAPAATAAPPGEDTASRVFAIFRSRCLSCHGNGQDKRVKVLSRAALVEQRKVVFPGKPAENSELFDLVRGKAMPPGDLPKLAAHEVDLIERWIQNDAPEPLQSGSAYIHEHLLADWKKLPAEEKKSARYVSLNHLIKPNRLAEARKELESVLTALGKQTTKLHAVDPQDSVFRINLGELGWDLMPFAEVEIEENAMKEMIRKPSGTSSVNLYDLLLLEYPFAMLDLTSPNRQQLAQYCHETDVLRPIAYLQGDWLTDILKRTKLGAEFAASLKRDWPSYDPNTENEYWGEELSIPEATSKIEWLSAPQEVRTALARLKSVRSTTIRSVSRRDLAMIAPRMVTEVSTEPGRIPVVPIDGLTLPEYQPPGAVRYSHTAFSAKSKQQTSKFKANEEAYLVETGSEALKTRVVIFGEDQKVSEYSKTPFEFKPPKQRYPTKVNEYFKSDDLPKGNWVSYAIAESDLTTAKVSYPEGILLAPLAKYSSSLRERFVHLTLYKLTAAGDKLTCPPACKLIKTTMTIETAK